MLTIVPHYTQTGQLSKVITGLALIFKHESCVALDDRLVSCEDSVVAFRELGLRHLCVVLKTPEECRTGVNGCCNWKTHNAVITTTYICCSVVVVTEKGDKCEEVMVQEEKNGIALPRSAKQILLRIYSFISDKIIIPAYGYTSFLGVHVTCDNVNAMNRDDLKKKMEDAEAQRVADQLALQKTLNVPELLNWILVIASLV
ncbi:hypothetical protein Tco_0281408 [Tanacetum coccineum]